MPKKKHISAGKQLNKQRGFGDSAREIFGACKKMTGAAAGYIALLSKDRKENVVAYLDPGRLKCTVDPKTPMPIRGMRKKTCRLGKTLCENNFDRSKWERFLPKGHVPVENVIFAPLKIDGKVVGLLGLANKPGGFVPRDMEIAGAFGELAAVTLHNSLLLEAIRRHEAQLEDIVKERTTELSAAAELLKETLNDEKKAKEELAEEKELLSVTLRSIGEGVIATDIEGRVILMNRVAEELTGMSSDKSLGMPLYRVYATKDLVKGLPRKDTMKKALGGSGMISNPEDAYLISKKGVTLLIEESVSTLRDKSSRSVGVVITFRDITERRKMEEEILNAQRMESLGVLAGGIAHDFNNALSAILANVSAARMMTVNDLNARELLGAAVRAIKRAGDHTRQLLTFSKGGKPVKKNVSISELIKESADFVLRGTGVRCIYKISKDLWPVEADEGQMGQVVGNILINAIQAMPGGGKLEIRADNLLTGRKQEAFLKSGKYIRLSFADEGCGIPAENMERIFEPYFTTKKTGSGLGLASTYSIIKKHGGHIKAQSREGKGSLFEVYLPASSGKISESKRINENAVPGMDRLSVLIMDDEMDIRESVAATLGIFGFKVKYAKDGKEAIRAYRLAKISGKPFDAVILDLIIPGGMGGVETMKRLRRLHPEIKAIVSSGYSNDPIMAEYGRYGFKDLLVKPFQVEDLVNKLKTVIGRG